ncbi:MAG: magnesium transporter [Alphaproteobacteria bacterium]|nr:magnesium transporter [Alphaproteobacteria bacterium]
MVTDPAFAEPDIVPTAPETVAIPVGLSDTDIRHIEDALRSGHEEGVIDALGRLGPPDTAELLEKLPEEHRTSLFENFAPALVPEALAELNPELRRQAMALMPPDQVADILAALESDDALHVIEDFDPPFQKEIIHHLSAKTRLTLEEGLTFPEESAGRLMSREFVAIPEFWVVGKTIDYLREAADELPTDFFDLFVITPAYRIAGEIRLGRLIRARRHEKLSDLTLDNIHQIPATMDQEEVAEIFRRENLTSAPVTDEESRLIGVITIDDVVDVIDEEAHEDFLRLAGVEQGDLYRAVLSTTASRFRWLFVNLLTAIAASLVISLFDATIQQVVALAVLMPIVASMGGNAGTQALTVAVRALATRQISRANAFRIIGKETLVGFLNGAAFAIITGLTAGLWFSSPMIGTLIAVAMIINLIVAGFFGAGIPILLQRMGSDPALSSTVFLTTVTDVVGFFAFLGLAALFLV